MSRPRVDPPDLETCLRALLDQVPAGRVTTHGRLAEALGDRVAARWVGHWVLHHEHAAGCACHRVVRVDGDVGGFVSGDEREKARLLLADGVAVDDARVDLARFGFDRFFTDRPLERLRAAQDDLRKRASLQAVAGLPELVAGVDVSYVSEHQAVGAYALVEMATRRLIWATTARVPVRFPYISSYLSFRELPVHLVLIDAARAAGRLAPVVLVDGTGILHPRRFGIASHLGVVAQAPTIGVTKKLLCGTIEGADPRSTREITHQGESIGLAILPTPSTVHPLYVSPGHLTDVRVAGLVVQRLLAGHRLPEPLYWADRLSREEARQPAG
jgi:deoxyribonuclease V